MILAEGEPGNPDAIYVYDPCLVTDDGAVLLRPGKPERQGEADALRATSSARACRSPGGSRRGRPRAATRVWLDAETLLVGHGYRTDDAGVAELARLTGAEVIVFDLPHWTAPAR